MGHAHGKKWTDELIKEGIYKVMKAIEISRMPSNTEIINVTNNTKLSNKISKTGGFEYWAKKINIPTKKSETKYGEDNERIAKQLIKENLGYEFKFTSARHPYDLYFNGIKIDVKSGNRYYYDKKNYYHTFNLEKIPPTCDIYMCICKNNDDIDKVLIVPSLHIDNMTQLSLGSNSIYDKYINKYDIIKKYYDFYKGGIQWH